MNRLLALLVVASILAVAGPAGKAEACSCALLDPTTALATSAAAFIGTVVERPDPNPAPGQTTAIWVFEVEEWVKGDMGERVGVHSGFSGADCGFEVGDEPVGVFLYNDDGRPSGGLCSTTSPEAMRGAGQPLVFDGEGPPVFLVATDTGRTRLATLDATGRLLAATGDERFGWSVAVCPGNELIVEVVEGEVTVRDLSLQPVRTVEPGPGDQVEQVWCLDPTGERLLTLTWNDSGRPTLQIMGGEVVFEGEMFVMDVSARHLAFVGHQSTSSLDVIDLVTGERSRIGPVTNVSTLEFSPDGHKLVVTEVEYFPDGGYQTVATVYSPAGEVLWTSPPLVDSSVYGWVDGHRLSGDRYPVDAETGVGLVIDTDDGSVIEVGELASYVAVGDSLVSVTERGLSVTDASGAARLLAPLPSPAHRLVAVFEPDMVLDVPDDEPTTTSIPPEAPAPPDPIAAPEEAVFPTGVAVAAAGGVALILAAGWRVIRRRRV